MPGPYTDGPLGARRVASIAYLASLSLHLLISNYELDLERRNGPN
jgi:hypothetical protein